MRLPVTSDPLTALLKHNDWATRRVLDMCSRVSPEQFHQRFEIGPGSLHDTLRHTLYNVRFWADTVADRPARPPLREAKDRWTVAEFAQMLDEATDDVAALVKRYRDRLGEVVNVAFDPNDPSVPFTRGVLLTHLLVHAIHHRAQCLNMLRHLNVAGVSDAIPDLDLNEWQFETEVKP